MKKFLCIVLSLLLSLPFAGGFAEEKGMNAEAETWLMEKSLELAALFNEMVHSDGYVNAFFGSAAAIEDTLADVRRIDYSIPTATLYLPMSQVFSPVMKQAMLGQLTENADMPEAVMDYFSHRLLNLLPGSLLGSCGVTVTALSSALTVSNAYVCPDFVQESAYVILQYEGDYSLIVAFNCLDTGAVTAQTTLLFTQALSPLLPK